ILGLEYRDMRIGRRHRDQCKHARAIDQVELLGRRHLPHDRVVGCRTGEEPESADFSLLGAAFHAAASADPANLVEVAAPGFRVERGWRSGTKLRAAWHRPWRHASP